MKGLFVGLMMLASGCQAQQPDGVRSEEQRRSPSDGVWRLQSLTGFEAVLGQLLFIERGTYTLEGCGQARGYIPTRDNPAIMKGSGLSSTCDDAAVAAQRALTSMLDASPTVERQDCRADERCPYKIVIRSADRAAVFHPMFAN
ncbi:hypothetical protein D3C71_1075640 [compost metagenome]